MRAVLLCGTHRWASSALSNPAILPPPLPVSATTRKPTSWAAWIASITFAELPLVEVVGWGGGRGVGGGEPRGGGGGPLGLEGVPHWGGEVGGGGRGAAVA